MMEILFRCDSGIEIGTGHVMRCLTLANALKEKGHLCYFVCREHQGNISEKITQQGFPLTLLPEIADYLTQKDLRLYQKWLGCSQEDDAQATIQAINGQQFDWVIVDHYGIDETWEKRLRSYCRRLMVIDDLANRKHDCDLLLDQSVVLDREDYASLIEHDFTFIGKGNILFRREFSNLSACIVEKRDIFICLGGADVGNITLKALKSLLQCCQQSLSKQELKITVVVGKAYLYLKELRGYIASQSEDVLLLVDISNMALTMRKHKVAIVSCGTMVLESCALGVASIGVAIADNQIPTANYLRNLGLILTVDLGVQDLQNQFDSLGLLDSLNNRKPYLSMTQKTQTFFNCETSDMIYKELSRDN